VRGSVVFDDVIAAWPGFPEADREIARTALRDFRGDAI
jgi:hypothetical protein